MGVGECGEAFGEGWGGGWFEGDCLFWVGLFGVDGGDDDVVVGWIVDYLER